MLLRILLLLLPLIMFALWIWARKKALDEGEDAHKIDIRMALLLVIGIVGILTLAWVLSTKESGNRDSLYVAPKVVDGQVVPGHFVDPEEVEKEQAPEEEPQP